MDAMDGSDAMCAPVQPSIFCREARRLTSLTVELVNTFTKRRESNLLDELKLRLNEILLISSSTLFYMVLSFVIEQVI
jgi:hypothetical protein